MDEPRTLGAARYLVYLGISVIPMRMDRSKRPKIEWKEYQSRLASPEELEDWFAGGAPLGVVTGAVSGNLVMAEIEGRALDKLPQLEQLARDSGFGETWDRLERGWKEISPSGGIHWFFRTVTPPVGNRKLAMRPSTPEELEAWKDFERNKAVAKLEEPQLAARLAKVEAATPLTVPQTLAETRGEGGFVVVFPTPGHFHETGQPWQIVFGTTPDQVPTLTDEETETFLTLLGTLDEMPARIVDDVPRQPRSSVVVGDDGGIRPGDDLEMRTSWREILEPHGWTIAKVQGSTIYWVRPGKNPRDGFSATTGHAEDRDRLYVFSSSTEFETERPYTMFSAYAVLNHGGDLSRAAAELRRLGYGRDPDNFMVPTPPRTGTTTSGADTRQDTGPLLNPDRDRANPEIVLGSVAPVTDIATKRRRGAVAVSRTDQGNADLFIHEHKSSVRFDTVRKVWFVWENTRWVPEPYSKHGNTLYRAQKIVQDHLPTENEDDRKWQIKCLNPVSYNRIRTLAAANPELCVTTEDFDAHPWELNTPGGIINLRTGELLPPDPKRLHSKSTETVPDYTADRSAWLNFLAQTFPENTEQMIEYVQRLAGYSLIGDTKAQIIIFGLGSGGNGKGVMMETIAKILGNGPNGYALNQPVGFLTLRAANDHPEKIANMKGARFVTVPEIDHNARLDEGLAKSLSGGDRVTARFMGEGAFSWDPTHQLWLTGNTLPRLDSGGGKSMFRRLKVIPFLHEVPKEQVDPGLKDRLVDEHGPAILAWLVEGAVKYAQQGIGEDPMTVSNATGSYRQEMDTLGMFIEEKCITYTEEERTVTYGVIPHVPVLALYEQYRRFCDANNMSRPISQIAMSRRLREEYQVFTNKWDHQNGKTDKNIRGETRYLWIELSDKTSRFGDLDDEGRPE